MATNNDEKAKMPETEQEILDSDLPLGQQIDLLLDFGKSKKQLLRMGFSDPLIRQRLKKRTKDGVAEAEARTTDLAAVVRGTEKITPFHTIELISNLLDGNEEQRAIFKAGLLVPILGMQLYNEGQKSFASYMNAMRSESQEAMMKALAVNQDAAHAAAMESAQLVASTMAASQKDAAIIGAKNPGQAMMFQTMQPMIKMLMDRVTSTLLPGMGGQQGAIAQGWTKRQVSGEEKPEKEIK